jgi:hypothetical protein
MSYPPPPIQSQICPAPPYNATNFNQGNSTILSTLQTYANNSPNYPWNTGTDAQQIYRSRQNIVYFNTLNQQTAAVRTANGNAGYAAGVTTGNIPYPRFKSDAERLMYIQGQALTSARNLISRQNPSAPMGVPCSTIYGIINNNGPASGQPWQ